MYCDEIIALESEIRESMDTERPWEKLTSRKLGMDINLTSPATKEEESGSTSVLSDGSRSNCNEQRVQRGKDEETAVGELEEVQSVVSLPNEPNEPLVEPKTPPLKQAFQYETTEVPMLHETLESVAGRSTTLTVEHSLRSPPYECSYYDPAEHSHIVGRSLQEHEEASGRRGGTGWRSNY